MTRRHDLEQRMAGLEDIRKIVRSMQSLAYIETRKLTRRLDDQQRLVRTVERAAADLLAFHPDLLPPAAGPSALILIGSERGFCGDFNARLVDHAASRMPPDPGRCPPVIGVGRRLCAQLQDRGCPVTGIDGADVAEEIDQVLTRILEAVQGLRERLGPLSLTTLFHRADGLDVNEKRLLPPFGGHAAGPPPSGVPPLLNLAPGEFLLGLVDHYLLAALHCALCASLMAENRRRVQQLEAAGRHLDERLETLGLTCRQLRQEEIIEEIEVILLGTTGTQPG